MLNNLYSFVLMGSTTGADEASGSYTMIIWIVVMVALFYFLLIRPQKKKEKADKALRSSIEPGDGIVTIGGMVGKVISIKDDNVVFEMGADRSKVTIKKWAVQTRTPKAQLEESKSE